MSQDQLAQPEIDGLLSGLGLDRLKSWGMRSRFPPERVVLVMHVHVLPSFVPLMRRLLEIGFLANNILVIAKSYSAIAHAVEATQALGVRVWQTDAPMRPGRYDEYAANVLRDGCVLGMTMALRPSIRRCILVDDGGLLTEAWRRCSGFDTRQDIVSVQQTSSGFGPSRWPSRSPYPKVDVARSAAKAEFESRIIAAGLLRAVEQFGLLHRVERVGVAGFGRLGKKLARRLSARAGVAFFDRRDISAPRYVRCDSAGELLAKSEVVFGCTGQNWLPVDTASAVSADVALVSCSSRDVEFQSALQKLPQASSPRADDPFGMMRLKTPKAHTLTVHNGGFPINFDRDTEWERAGEIAITRALILGGVLQAMATPARHVATTDEVYMLEPELQREIVLRWLGECVKRDLRWFDVSRRDVEDLQWWTKRSYPALRLKQ